MLRWEWTSVRLPPAAAPSFQFGRTSAPTQAGHYSPSSASSTARPSGVRISRAAASRSTGPPTSIDVIVAPVTPASTHRGQAKKRPLTAEELEKKGLTKV
jgi:hypothetical protein